MDLGYAEYMSQKEADDRKPFAPTPVRRTKPHEAKWRTDKALIDKVASIAAVEACKAELESGVTSEISFNSQLTHIAKNFVLTYEEEFGDLPGAKDLAAVKRYAQSLLKK